jgi:hypothetical protein
MPKAGPITSAGWPRLQPGATLARTPGTAVLAGSDCSPLNAGCRCGTRLARSGEFRSMLFEVRESLHDLLRVIALQDSIGLGV